MNDEIKKLNDENDRQDNEVSPGNQSQANNSKITHPDEDGKNMAQQIIADLSNQRADIDKNIQMTLGLVDELNKTNTLLNQIAQVLNQRGQTQAPNGNEEVQPPVNLEAIGQIGDVLEKLVSAYKNFKGSPNTAPSLIDQDFINEKMKQSFLDNLQTGEAITTFIKDSLKKKVTKEVINTSLADMGNDSHAPQ